MKERPIIFSSEMVRAILEGRKTQTRRVIKPQPLASYLPDSDILKRLKAIPKHTVRIQDKDNPQLTHVIPHCPYGQVGDRLWCKETWQFDDELMHLFYKADGPEANFQFGGPWRSPLFMPRWASRITLEITGIRAERLQNITEEDAKAEGVVMDFFASDRYWPTHRDKFSQLWESLNTKRGYPWASNPWVWRIEFKELPK